MKTFLKTLIGGALGLGALYAVGKICYEAGKEVGQVEQQLETKTKENVEKAQGADTDGDHVVSDFGDDRKIEDETETTDEKVRKAREQFDKDLDEAWEKHTKPTLIGKAVNKFRNLKKLMKAGKIFGGGGRKPGVLSTLLNNPEGTRIEAFVKDGGVQIHVQPNAA